MLTFNRLLEIEHPELDLNDVGFAWHKNDPTSKNHRDRILSLFCKQLEGEGNVFDARINWSEHKYKYIAVFVKTVGLKSVFAGIYQKNSNPQNDVKTEDNVYLQKTDYLDAYIGKLFIDWAGERQAWKARRCIKQLESKLEIKEISQDPIHKKFQGFDHFSLNLNDFESLSATAIAVLENTTGIYLVTCLESGFRYVGSAYRDKGGFYGRFQDYAKQGDGGNLRIKAHNNHYSPFAKIITILEVVLKEEKIHEKETIWKKKLLSRHEVFGLNEN